MADSSTSERDALIAEMVKKMRRQLEKELPDKNATLDQIEAVAGRIGRQLSQDVKQRLTEKRNDKPNPPNSQ